MADELTDQRRRSKILQKRAERRAYNQPRIPWYARVWNWFLPGTYSQENARTHLGIVLGIIFVILALLGVIAWNLFGPSSFTTRVVVADGVFASGQEANVIEDFESQGFQEVAYESGLGVVAYGTDEMARQYREAFGSKYVDDATETLKGTHDAIGIVAFNHSEQWDVISVSTYTNEVDVELFQFMLTTDADITNALEEWIAWGVIQNGNSIKVDFLDATGSRYFEVDGISSVADIMTETRDSNPAGIDWDAVSEEIVQAGSESAQEDSSQEDESE